MCINCDTLHFPVWFSLVQLNFEITFDISQLRMFSVLIKCGNPFLLLKLNMKGRT